MKKTKMLWNVFLLIVVATLSSCNKHKDNYYTEISPVIDESRLVLVEVPITIDEKGGHKYKKIQFLDTYKESICNIVKELNKINFPIYEIDSYACRNSINKKTTSMHAYASAIDINHYQNPYFHATYDLIIPGKEKRPQIFCNKRGFEDYYLNRSVVRRGMITGNEAAIFARNGFTIWGGSWREPMDYMHFQTTRPIAKIVNYLNPSEAKIFWKEYLKNPAKIAKDPFFAANDIDVKNIKLDDLIKRMHGILNDS